MRSEWPSAVISFHISLGPRVFDTDGRIVLDVTRFYGPSASSPRITSKKFLACAGVLDRRSRPSMEIWRGPVERVMILARRQQPERGGFYDENCERIARGAVGLRRAAARVRDLSRRKRPAR